MVNKFYQKGNAINPFTTAKAEDVNDELSKVEAGFDKLPEPKDDGTGFTSPVNVGDATEAGHAVNKGQFDAVVGGVFTARDEAQQAASTATVKASQVSTDATQVSNDAAQVTTQAATVNTQYGEVNAKHADVVAKHSDVVTKHSDVVTKHAEVVTMHSEVATAHDEYNRYHLGAKATEPTVDNNGDPLKDGAEYFNTTNNKSYVYNSGAFHVTNFSSATLTEKTSLAGATILPSGPTADRPDPAQLNPNQAYIRGNTDLGEFEGIIVGQTEWGSIGGGGLTKPSKPDVSEYPYTLKKGQNLKVDVSDGVSKVVNFPSGQLVGFGGTISLSGWTGDPSVSVRINVDAAQKWDHPEMEAGDSLTIRGNQFVTLLIAKGDVLEVVDCGGENQRVEKRGETKITDTRFQIVSAGTDVNVAGGVNQYDEIIILHEVNNAGALNGLRESVVKVSTLERHVDSLISLQPTTSTSTGAAWVFVKLKDENTLNISAQGSSYQAFLVDIYAIKY